MHTHAWIRLSCVVVAGMVTQMWGVVMTALEVERLEMAVDWKMNWLRDCPAVHFVVSNKACTCNCAGSSLVELLRS